MAKEKRAGQWPTADFELAVVKKPGGNQVLDIDNRTYNALLRGVRAPGERGFALLKTRWKALQHVTACPTKTETIGKAALVLTLFEHKLIPC